jgi:hypothetical protein
MASPKLEMIMERVGPGNKPESFRMWACRGAGRGCQRNKHRNVTRHCDDCVPADDDETLEQLDARMRRGDA